MFGVDFSELLLIGIVALIIFGPEDLPRVARTVGHLLGKFRRYVADVKSDISREMELADVKRLHDELKDGARSLQESFDEQTRSLEADLHASFRDEQPESPTLPAFSALPVPALEPLVPEPSSVEPEVFSASSSALPVQAESQPDLFGEAAEPVRRA